MPRFSANLSFLFADRPFLDRFAAAADAGFTAVEFHFPYAEPADCVAEAARAAGVEVVLFNFPAGDWTAGERGVACLPDRVPEFRAGVAQALAYADALGCRRLNVLAGCRPRGVSPATLDEVLCGNLRYAADAAVMQGCQVLIEPLNTVDTPGFHVSDPAHACALLDQAGVAGPGLQLDLYHTQVMCGDLARTVARHLPRIGHLQFADNPGRHQPGTGEIRFEWLFAEIDRLGYEGWLGAEYHPLPDDAGALGWFARWRSVASGDAT